jgi:4-amino-4-deoxychorismate lyase
LKTLINGQCLDSISVNDRGLLYGDGVFETCRILRGVIVLFDEHMKRLQGGCNRLGIALNLELLSVEIDSVLADLSPEFEGVLKVIVTRGVSSRGYAPLPDAGTTRILQCSELNWTSSDKSKTGVNVLRCTHTLPRNQATAGMKHLNRLDQVLASAELGPDFEEGIVLDCENNVVEGTKSNLFFVTDEKLITPDLSYAGVEGIMRAYLIENFARDGVGISTGQYTMEDLKAAQEIFMCNSVFGIWPVIKINENGNVYSWLIGPMTKKAIAYQHEIFSHTD